MPRVRMPTGEIVDMPDNPTPEQVAALAAIHAPQATAPQRSPLAQVGRSIGLAARMPLQAVAGTAGMVGDALNTAINMGGEAIGHNPNLGMPSRAIQSGIDTITPVPENTGERVSDFVGSTLAAGVSKGVDPLARLLTRHLQPAASRVLTERQRTIREAQRAGYVVTPSKSEGGFIGTQLEGMANKSLLANEANIRNQRVTDRLARKAAGLANDTPLTDGSLQAAIKATYETGYKPIEQAGQITTGRVYREALDKALTEFQGASRSFPQAAHDDVRQLIDSYRVRNFDAGDAVQSIRDLRESANAAFRSGNPNLAKTSLSVARALEDNIELNLAARGRDGAGMLKAFKDARKLLAKQDVVRKVVEAGTGSANALKIASQLQRHPGRLTDELEMIGKFANTAQTLAKMPTSVSSPYSAFGGVPTAITGALAGPVAGGVVAGMPIARSGLRAAMLSSPAQRMMGPQIDPNILSRFATNPSVLNAMPTALMQGGLYGETDEELPR